MPTKPLSPYALQKLVAEQYCQMFTRLYGLETVTVRYFNVFGPPQDPSSPYSGVISLFSTALLEGRQPTLNGISEPKTRTGGTDIKALYKEARAGDVRDSQADITKAKNLLGYAPTVDLETGLRHTLVWCRAEAIKV